MRFLYGLKNTVLAVGAILNIHSQEVCYNEVGCFDNAVPFNNAGGLLPQSPEEIGVNYLLYTRRNHVYPQSLTTHPLVIRTSNYRGYKATKFIIHGYRDNGREAWVNNMTSAILKREDVNVIVVDWEKGANKTNYEQAVANTRMTGALIAMMMTSLVTSTGALFSNMHLIGHSLGAHIAGYAGVRTLGLGRITGLDPAGPSFENKDPRVRLDPGDALFVDAIHTDGEHLKQLGFGIAQPVGDADFYPNGGQDQPGCKAAGLHLFKLLRRKFKDFAKGVGCSHARAVDLFTESISVCLFPAFPCESREAFKAGKCFCYGNCALMGYDAERMGAQGRYELVTTGKSPFCSKFQADYVYTTWDLSV